MRGLPITLAIAAAGLAQAPPAQQPPVIRTTTRLVQVNVIVHDKNGPVADLKKDDFAIFDRGKPRAIAFFAIDTVRSALPNQAPALPPHIFVNALARRTGIPASITVILLDGLNTRIQDQIYAREQVKKFLGKLQPQDRVAIYTLGKTLRVLHDFTADPAELERALARFRGRLDSDLDATNPAPADTGDARADEQLNIALENMADFYRVNQVRQTADALQAIAHHVAPLPGRKNLVWVSGSFPFSIGLEEMNMNRPNAERRTFNEEIEATARALNDASMAIYPVDARGLVALPESMTASSSVRMRPAARPPSVQLTPPGLDTMEELASRTGGKAFYNTNDIAGAVRQAIEDTQVTYTLGFYPEAGTLDGKYHELKVQVPRRAGLNVRFRKGYYAMNDTAPGPAALKAQINQALWSPLESSGLTIAARLERVRTTEGEAVRTVIGVPIRQLALEQKNDRWTGGLDVVVAQLDTNGRVLEATNETITINLKDESYRRYLRNGLPFVKAVKIHPLAQQFRLVLVDRASGGVGSLITPMSEITAAPSQPATR